MSMSFFDQLNATLNNSPANRSVTENGAIGYKSTGKKLLDLNFAVSSARSFGEAEIRRRFAEALGENPLLAIVWLFFVRDVRGGLGERRFFRICMTYLAEEFSSAARKLLPLIAEYGRWDDVIDLYYSPLKDDVVKLIRDQLTEDMKNYKQGKSISLLAKWMPSENASSKATSRRAVKLCSELSISPRAYRKMLSALRKHLEVIERKMSANEWEGIDYQAVPSRANLIYNSAFLRHDEERRRNFLSKLEKGEAKINSSVLFPHDILHKYPKYATAKDAAVEGMWKGLPPLPENNGGTIVVADGSGSMTCGIAGTSVSALEVANSLAIYFAERLNGPYRDKYITFSETPKLVDLSGASSLFEKNKIARRHNEVADTNVEAVFDLILKTAIKHGLEQKDLPKNILIISDMEFNSCACCNSNAVSGRYFRRYREEGSVNSALFEEISKKYKAHGYHLPRLVFWNVNSRTGTIPVKENDAGVALVSGFSPNVAKMVMSGKLDPFEALVETLNDKRYDPVREALKK